MKDRLADTLVRPQFERRVVGVPPMGDVRIVVTCVVAADQGPSRVFAIIAAGAVEQIAVKEQCIPRFHFTIDQFMPLHRFGNARWIRTLLIAGRRVVDAS